MEAFKSSDLKEHHAEVLVYAEVAPTILLDDGQPRAVIMSVAEYQRLKAAAREPVPKEAHPRRPLVLHARKVDLLGYDTSDFASAARQMAADNRSGKTAAAVAAETMRVRARFGRIPKPDDEPPVPLPER